jgi:hypothetical protein
MIVSTFFTLVLIPAGFSLVMDAKEAIARLISRQKPKPTTMSPSVTSPQA